MLERNKLNKDSTEVGNILKRATPNRKNSKLANQERKIRQMTIRKRKS